MKQLFFHLPALQRTKNGILIHWVHCKLTAWGIRIGDRRLQWRDSNGWCWRTKL